GGERLHEEVVEGLDERALVHHRHRLDGGARPPGSEGGGRAARESCGQEFASSAHGTSSATGRTDGGRFTARGARREGWRARRTERTVRDQALTASVPPRSDRLVQRVRDSRPGGWALSRRARRRAD